MEALTHLAEPVGNHGDKYQKKKASKAMKVLVGAVASRCSVPCPFPVSTSPFMLRVWGLAQCGRGIQDKLALI